MMGQANVFFRYFPEKIPAAIDRYQNESQRLLSVLDQHLSDKEFLCEEFSIADITNWCWARTHEWSGVDISEMAHLKRWIDTMHARQGCYKGIKVPGKVDPADIVKSGKTLIV